MGLAEFYFYMFKKKLKKYHLPEELKYLAIIESNLNPKAKSKVGAKGLWQFMPSTGKQYGLIQNENVSLFADPIASTDAACRYLKYLFDKFGDWEMALAAYNYGEGRIGKLIKKHNTTDFWKLKKYLPKETQNYVPSFLAIQYIFNFYESHGIKPRKFSLDYKNVLVLKAEKNYKISELYTSKKEEEIFKFLNPQLKKNTIAKNTYFYTLKSN